MVDLSRTVSIIVLMVNRPEAKLEGRQDEKVNTQLYERHIKHKSRLKIKVWMRYIGSFALVGVLTHFFPVQLHTSPSNSQVSPMRLAWRDAPWMAGGMAGGRQGEDLRRYMVERWDRKCAHIINVPPSEAALKTLICF